MPHAHPRQKHIMLFLGTHVPRIKAFNLSFFKMQYANEVVYPCYQKQARERVFFAGGAD